MCIGVLETVGPFVSGDPKEDPLSDNLSDFRVCTRTFICLHDEMTVSYHSRFRSLCSVPVFRWFHVPSSCVLVCIFTHSLNVVSCLIYSRFPSEYFQIFLGI
jgi:hypothetical protein